MSHLYYWFAFHVWKKCISWALICWFIFIAWHSVNKSSLSYIQLVSPGSLSLFIWVVWKLMQNWLQRLCSVWQRNLMLFVLFKHIWLYCGSLYFIIQLIPSLSFWHNASQSCQCIVAFSTWKSSPESSLLKAYFTEIISRFPKACLFKFRTGCYLGLRLLQLASASCAGLCDYEVMGAEQRGGGTARGWNTFMILSWNYKREKTSALHKLVSRWF